MRQCLLSPCCVRLYTLQDAAFDPSASNTSLILSCQDPGCKCGRQRCGCSNNQCTYVRRYGVPLSKSQSSSIHCFELGSHLSAVFGPYTTRCTEHHLIGQQAEHDHWQTVHQKRAPVCASPVGPHGQFQSQQLLCVSAVYLRLHGGPLQLRRAAVRACLSGTSWCSLTPAQPMLCSVVRRRRRERSTGSRQTASWALAAQTSLSSIRCGRASSGAVSLTLASWILVNKIVAQARCTTLSAAVCRQTAS